MLWLMIFTDSLNAFPPLLVLQASDASSEKLFNTVLVNKGKTRLLF